MTLNLLDIEAACGPALGGLREIALIDPNDLLAPIVQYCEPVVEDVVLNTGKRSFTIKHILTNASYTDRLVLGNKAGDYYETTIAFGIKKIRVEAEQLIERLKNNFFHLLVTGADGHRRLVVNLRLEAETSTGSRLSDRAGYQFNCRARRAKKMPIMGGIVNSGTIDFSGDFHLFFKDTTGQYYHLTVDTDGSMVTTAASPTGYSNVIIVAPPFGISVDTLGALITP